MAHYSTEDEIKFINSMHRTREELRRKGTKLDPPFMDELSLLRRYRSNMSMLRINFGTINKPQAMRYLDQRISQMEAQAQ